MMSKWGLLLLTFTCVRTNESISMRDMVDISFTDKNFAFWPSFLNGVTSMKVRTKRQAPHIIMNEGGGVEPVQQNSSSSSNPEPQPDPSLNTQITSNSSVPKGEANIIQATNNTISNSITTISTASNGTVKNGTATNDIVINGTIVNGTATNDTTTNGIAVNSKAINGTSPDAASFDLKDPGVLKRTMIVFGGFTLLGVAYYIFYRRKNNKKDMNNGHGLGDTNQFRYGVLQSEDTRDKMELSRIPLTMESDDEEDEDLEIFDLEQKKKSLSYVNLQINDEEIVNLSNNSKDDGDAILLDIEDRGTETLINWSNNGSKSIL